MQPVMVGDGQRLIAELDRAPRQLLGQRGAFEKRVTGVEMQLGSQIFNRRTNVLHSQAGCRRQVLVLA
jgi:hypothetical protein